VFLKVSLRVAGSPSSSTPAEASANSAASGAAAKLPETPVDVFADYDTTATPSLFVVCTPNPSRRLVCVQHPQAMTFTCQFCGGQVTSFNCSGRIANILSSFRRWYLPPILSIDRQLLRVIRANETVNSAEESASRVRDLQHTTHSRTHSKAHRPTAGTNQSGYQEQQKATVAGNFNFSFPGIGMLTTHVWLDQSPRSFALATIHVPEGQNQ
jgi:hypothetical protein